MGRIQLELIYLYFPPSSHLVVLDGTTVENKGKLILTNRSIWKQDPEANIWAQEGWEWGVEKAPQWGTSEFVPFT